MRQRSGGRMKRPRPDGASLSRHLKNASGPQITSRITPGTVRVEIDRQGLELLRNHQSLAYADYLPASPQDLQRRH
jgi:hypothetical protein